MFFNIDEYLTDNSDKFVIENRHFLKKSLLLLYFLLFIYIFMIFILYYFLK